VQSFLFGAPTSADAALKMLKEQYGLVNQLKS
jgi:hypothetical protein